MLSTSKYGSRDNKWGLDTYKTLYKDYLKDCFIKHFGKNHSSLFFLLGDSNHKEMPPIKILFDQLVSKKHSPLELGSLWLQILNYHYDFVSISPETYQDYVELASALDLIEEDSQT